MLAVVVSRGVYIQIAKGRNRRKWPALTLLAVVEQLQKLSRISCDNLSVVKSNSGIRRAMCADACATPRDDLDAVIEFGIAFDDIPMAGLTWDAALPGRLSIDLSNSYDACGTNSE